MISDWKDKKIGILGLGIEGVSTAHFLSTTGAVITVLDKNEEKDVNQTLLSGVKKLGVSFIFGKEYLKQIDTYDVIVRSPGIKTLTPELVAAREKGITVTSQTQMFLDACPCPVIGVTGTKGKGTTSTLIAEMLKKEGFDTYIGGNIGLPPLTFLNKLTPKSRVVLELSSFQLQDVTKSPHIAVMLMVTSEHLDYHADTYEYVEAKRNILRFQTKEDFAVINRDYVASLESDIHTEGEVYYVSRERSTQRGCYIKDNAVYISLKEDNEEKIVNTDDILLPGKHNLENICAATLAAILCGVKVYSIASVLKTFKGLEHRLELIAEKNGVKYYDDSFSTTPETAIAAIEAFSAPEILILGGSHKGSDFSQLGLTIREAKNIKAIIGIGVEWEKIHDEIGELKKEILIVEGAKDMQTIVQAASRIAEKGDVVLLSPACASFDMFKNYKERGNQFKEEVQNLKS